MSMNERTGSRRRWFRARPRPRWTGVLAVTVGLLLLTVACGGSPGATSTPSASTPSTSTASAIYSARLAFASCVRAHGVPNYPDPLSNGQEPYNTKQMFDNDPQMRTAAGACQHLLPNGGQPTQTPQANALSKAGAVRLAGCMRTHGYPTFPDPTIDSVGQPVFNVRAAGIAPQSPQVLTVLRRCLTLLHLTGIPQQSG
jgi:hypothetical protein